MACRSRKNPVQPNIDENNTCSSVLTFVCRRNGLLYFSPFEYLFKTIPFSPNAVTSPEHNGARDPVRCSRRHVVHRRKVQIVPIGHCFQIIQGFISLRRRRFGYHLSHSAVCSRRASSCTPRCFTHFRSDTDFRRHLFSTSRRARRRGGLCPEKLADTRRKTPPISPLGGLPTRKLY